MRTVFSCLLAVAVLLAPRVSSAKSISLILLEPGVYFDASGARASDHYGIDEDVLVDGQPPPASRHYDCCFDGWASLAAGPLASLTLTGDPEYVIYSAYRYTAGTATVKLSWEGEDGGHTGYFHGILSDLEIDLEEECLSADCDSEESEGDVYASLGRGFLDRDLARALGVPRLILGGSYYAATDEVTGNPWDGQSRLGGSQNGTGELVLDVPEPSVMWLLLAAVLLAGGRFRRAISRSSGA